MNLLRSLDPMPILGEWIDPEFFGACRLSFAVTDSRKFQRKRSNRVNGHMQLFHPLTEKHWLIYAVVGLCSQVTPMNLIFSLKIARMIRPLTFPISQFRWVPSPHRSAYVIRAIKDQSVSPSHSKQQKIDPWVYSCVHRHLAHCQFWRKYVNGHNHDKIKLMLIRIKAMQKSCNVLQLLCCLNPSLQRRRLYSH